MTGALLVVVEPPGRRRRDDQEPRPLLPQSLQRRDRLRAVGRVVPRVLAVPVLREVIAAAVAEADQLPIAPAYDEDLDAGGNVTLNLIPHPLDQVAVAEARAGL